MACACKGRKSTKYVWTSEPDTEGKTTTITYNTQIEARAKVMRAGGAYVPQAP